MAKAIKKIVNIRLRPDQEERINAIVERSAILDTSKFVRIAVDWLLRSDIGEVIKTIVDDGAFPDYQIPKKPAERKKRAVDKLRGCCLKYLSREPPTCYKMRAFVNRALLVLVAFFVVAPTFGKEPAPDVTFVSPCECVAMYDQRLIDR